MTHTQPLSVLERFFEDFPQGGSLLIVAHNHPDPDTIASAAALREIASVLGKAKTTIAYGGILGRAENANMVKYLKLELRPIDEISIKSFDRIAMVDTQPTTGNNDLPDELMPDLVIDHHSMIKATQEVPFVDIRLDYGATASILSEYLFQFDLPIDKNLATALLYGIKSETQDLGREAYSIDVEVYHKLFPIANKKLLSKIVHAKVPKSYFAFLVESIQNAKVAGNAVVTRLGEVEAPDIVPEIADMMMRMEGAAWALCTGQYKNGLHLSIRTTNAQKDAGKLMKRLVRSKGKGGGHNQIAGGRIPVDGLETWEIFELQDLMEEKFLKSIKKDQYAKQPLVPDEHS
ncbi:MAG: DHH family phosphoesterase [Bdellovibrionales bacterium]|nr:DHH family phosphoesterase [Bdellovibrionales bacterium]